ncbi:unnamed protein product [Brassica oleracea]
MKMQVDFYAGRLNVTTARSARRIGRWIDRNVPAGDNRSLGATVQSAEEQSRSCSRSMLRPEMHPNPASLPLPTPQASPSLSIRHTRRDLERTRWS